MKELFVSEAITPVEGTMDTAAMARGEPGLPMRFIWRGREYAVDAVLDRWKDTSPCKSGSPERYVRKHWYKIRTAGGEETKIYLERQARSRSQAKSRWWLYTVSDACDANPPPGANGPGEEPS